MVLTTFQNLENILPITIEAYHLLYEKGLIPEKLDRKKANIYANGNVTEYLILNLIDNKIEIYKNPGDGIYTEIKILSKEEIFVSSVIKELSFSLHDFKN